MVRNALGRWGRWMSDTTRRVLADAGLLVLRIGAGLMMILLHGWGKLAGFTERAGTFPDPLGVGSTVSLSLAIFAEVFCSILVIAGFATRLATIPLIITMSVAGFIIHADDPWAVKELAFLYLAVFVSLLLTGPGRYSIDGLLFRLRREP